MCGLFIFMKYIPLRGKYGEGKFAIVDDEDHPILNRINWTVSDNGYPKNGHFTMHRLVLGFPRARDIDHINQDKLDNRKRNLRGCGRSINSANRGKQSLLNATSLYKGVSYNKKRNEWSARVHHQNKQYNLGTFKNEHHAALMYDFWATYFFGDNIKTNFNRVGRG